jgi:hypothetical protein
MLHSLRDSVEFGYEILREWKISEVFYDKHTHQIQHI